MLTFTFLSCGNETISTETNDESTTNTEIPTKEQTIYEKLKEFLDKDYSAIELSIETKDGEETLSSKYTTTKVNDTTYTVDYYYDQYNTFTVDGDGNITIPDEYKTRHSGSLRIENGTITNENGEKINVSLDTLKGNTIKFDKEYFSDVVFENNSFKATVTNPKDFCGLENASEMTIEISTEGTTIQNILVSYLQGETNVTINYKFTK